MSNVLNMVSEESFIAQTEKIVKAITGESGTPFKLLSDMVNTIEVVNGTFTLNYEGEPPQGISEVHLSVILPIEKKGASTIETAYQIQNIDTDNKKITFMLDGQADGVINSTEVVLAMLMDEDINFLFPALVKVQGLPVNYDMQLVQPQGADQIVTIDGTQESRIDLTDINGVNCIAPNSVTPQINIQQNPWSALAFAYIFDESTNAYTYEEFVIEGTEVVIPANTFAENENILTIALYYNTSGTARTVSEIDLSIHL